MENTASIKKWSELRGLAVVAIDTGKKIGTLDDFYFETGAGSTMNRIYAFRVKTGLLSQRVLPVKAITAVGEHAITIAEEKLLIHEKHDKRLEALTLGQSLISDRVLSAGGTLLGTVGNMLLDISNPQEPRLDSIEMSGGLRERISQRYATFPADKVISYGQDAMIIPDDVAGQL